MPPPLPQLHHSATDVTARSAHLLTNGFQLLLLRQFHRPGAPSTFALIDQSLFRQPDRPSRHGIAFEITFLPEVVSSLIGQVGPPSRRDGNGMVYRNPNWPEMSWTSEERSWPDETQTQEWSARVTFPDNDIWTAFWARWHARLGT